MVNLIFILLLAASQSGGRTLADGAASARH